MSLLLILSASLIAVASPGPASIGIANASLNHGRRFGMCFALGVTGGAIIWSVLAALGVGTLMVSHAWMMETLRYLGAGYLLYLAFRSAKSAFQKPTTVGSEKTGPQITNVHNAFMSGFAVHITNPKPMLFFGSLYAVAFPVGTPISSMVMLNALIVFQGFLVFQGYAVLFSKPSFRAAYLRLSRWFNAAFAAVFGMTGLGLLATQWK